MILIWHKQFSKLSTSKKWGIGALATVDSNLTHDPSDNL
ncbi:hypothetical protein CPK_ORF00728 [Chlamydia pneumoniae LPCoLN]|nr:hypothetical protein CPK_ORF00728 [Chlamydia pneumoniae LPCoLN]